MKKIISKILTSALSLSLLASIAFAQVTETPPTEIKNVIDRITGVLKALGVLIAVFFVILGGYKFMTSGGSSEKVEEAKKDIMWALVGVVIIVLAQVLVYVACWLATGNINCKP